MARSTNPVEPSARPYLLPTDLPKALTWLTLDELDTLVKAVELEQKRRAGPAAKDFEPRAAGMRSGPNPGGPRVGQINAIRAAIKAGVKPTAIAKQFGVTKTAIAEIASIRSHRS
jgi:hypothetical protein